MVAAMQTSNAPKMPELHPDELVLNQDGTVRRHESWCCWNGTNWPTIVIERQANGTFESHISDPEHGGGSARGTFEEVTRGLHPKIVEEYRQLFALKNPTAQDIKAVGFNSNVTITQKA